MGESRPRAATRGAILVVGAVAAILALGGCAGAPSASSGERPTGHRPTEHTPPPEVPLPRPVPSTVPGPQHVGFDPTAQSFDDPASTWVVVNKPRALQPVDFTPPDLVYPDVTYVNRQPMRQPVADALVAMFQAGKQEAGLDFSVQSAYRSFQSQTRVYGDDVARHGQDFADTDTARPGHSEHQTGLAVDISAVPAKCSLAACFGETPHGMWLAANAWRFGFILRYPIDKVDVTGFVYEPWHFRFVGVPLATQLHATGVATLEEFFHCDGGGRYH